MRRLLLLVLLALLASALGCGGGARGQHGGAPVRLLHSPELNEIMKNEVNQPFSALMFLVFHADEGDGEGEGLDFVKIGVPVATLRTGIAKVRAMLNPPVQTAEAREVFVTYVDALVRDSESLSLAYASKDRGQMEGVLKKITHTCNDCHHFFRLKVVGEGPPPPSVVMVEPAFVP
jgi:hypothetical protein